MQLRVLVSYGLPIYAVSRVANVRTTDWADVRPRGNSLPDVVSALAECIHHPLKLITFRI